MGDMNHGDCPYDDCKGTLCMAVPERTPAYVLTECDTCKRKVWYRLSCLDPEAWTQADFEAEHEIDNEAHTIKKRESPINKVSDASDAFAAPLGWAVRPENVETEKQKT